MAYSSYFPRLEFVARWEDGSEQPCATRVVKVKDATNQVDLDDMNTDANGIVEAGSLPVPVGTTIRVRIEDFMGGCGALEFVTMEEPEA